MIDIDVGYGPIIQMMSKACEKAGGKVSLLRFMAELPCEGVRITPDHLCELFQRGVFNYTDGYFWPPSMDNCEYKDSNQLLLDMMAKIKKGLSIEMLFRTTPAGMIPANLKFQFAKFYYGLNSEETLDIYAEYLDHASRDQLGNYDDESRHYYLTELFGETVTDKLIDRVRLSVKMEAIRKRKVREDLNARRERLIQDLANVNSQLENLPNA